jgi:serine/threonine-protein kinase RsbW
MNQPYTLHLSAELKNLAVIRRFMEEAAMELQAPRMAIEEMTLAVDEAVTNVIIHGYRRGPGTIEIKMYRDGDLLVVSLRDQAPPFDPTTVPKPDLDLPLDRRPLGGMGVYLIRESVDEILHRVLPQVGNELTLIKKVFKSTNSSEESNEHHG